MNKWIAEFDLEDGDTMPEHMDLEYKGVKLDFHCRPKEPILDKIRAEIDKIYEREDNSVDCLSALDELKLFIENNNGFTDGTLEHSKAFTKIVEVVEDGNDII